MKNQLYIRREIAGRLQAAREAAGYKTAADFCSNYEIPLPEYVRYESAKTSIIASHAVKYCELLKISLYHLMIGVELGELKKWRDKRRVEANKLAALKLKAKKAKAASKNIRKKASKDTGVKAAK
jgi:hypothetical protein